MQMRPLRPQFQLTDSSFGRCVSCRSRVYVLFSLDLNLPSSTVFACSLVSEQFCSSDMRSHHAQVKEIWKRLVRKACVR
jgi:hypothetical protein